MVHELMWGNCHYLRPNETGVLEKYQEYCHTKDKREELFKMVQKDDESLEDFVERILYNV